jgi:hypothetical protein
MIKLLISGKEEGVEGGLAVEKDIFIFHPPHSAHLSTSGFLQAASMGQTHSVTYSVE